MINGRKFLKSFTYAFAGIDYALNSDQNLLIHLIVAIGVVIASLVFQVTPYEMGLLGVTILLVIATEMLNTSIEKMVDLITKEHRMEAKIAKDVSSGMVLITAIGSVVVGIIVFAPYVIKLMK